MTDMPLSLHCCQGYTLVGVVVPFEKLDVVVVVVAGRYCSGFLQNYYWHSLLPAAAVVEVVHVTQLEKELVEAMDVQKNASRSGSYCYCCWLWWCDSDEQMNVALQMKLNLSE